MPSPKIPRGKSDAEIALEASLEKDRVKFENEKRRFLEHVGAYETIATNSVQGARHSFEYADQLPGANPNGSGLYIPSRFNPTFDPSKYVNQDLSGFAAPNLGLGDPTFRVTTPFQSSNSMIGNMWGSQMPWQRGWSSNVSQMSRGFGSAVWRGPRSILRRIF
jgi:hypothetical protein